MDTNQSPPRAKSPKASSRTPPEEEAVVQADHLGL